MSLKTFSKKPKIPTVSQKIVYKRNHINKINKIINNEAVCLSYNHKFKTQKLNKYLT